MEQEEIESKVWICMKSLERRGEADVRQQLGGCRGDGWSSGSSQGRRPEDASPVHGQALTMDRKSYELVISQWVVGLSCPILASSISDSFAGLMDDFTLVLLVDDGAINILQFVLRLHSLQ